MKKLDSFEVFRAIKDDLRLFADTIADVDTYNFDTPFFIDGYEYAIIFHYDTSYSRILNIAIYDIDLGNVEENNEYYLVEVDNEDYLQGLIMGCLFDTYK